MTARRQQLVAVEGEGWQERLSALEALVQRGERKPLRRLAAEGDAAAEEALHELAAFPSRFCAALEPVVILDPARCSFGAGCPVGDECPLAGEGGPASIPAAAVSRFLAAFVDASRVDAGPCPGPGLAGLRDAVARLLEASGACGPDAPPRRRTSLTVLDLALRRGGPFGATGPFLGAAELERVAAFVPPGSSRRVPDLAEAEVWLRRLACLDAAIVEPR